MALLKAAVSVLRLMGTAVAPAEGVVAVTAGAIVAVLPPVPKIGAWPAPPPPQPAAIAVKTDAINHGTSLE
jgi:hypothetical protein